MKQPLFLLTFLLSINLCFGQKHYVGHSTLNNNLKKLILIDTTSGLKFTLDSTQIYVTAFDRNGKQLWRTNPWKDNKIIEYSVTRPIIIQFDFANNKQTNNQEVIWIVYNNTQFGIINKSTGKFKWLGQD